MARAFSLLLRGWAKSYPPTKAFSRESGEPEFSWCPVGAVMVEPTTDQRSKGTGAGEAICIFMRKEASCRARNSLAQFLNNVVACIFRKGSNFSTSSDRPMDN